MGSLLTFLYILFEYRRNYERKEKQKTEKEKESIK